MASAGGPPAEVLIDSSAVCAHRCAAGGKGGSANKRSDARAAAGRPRSPALTDRYCRPLAFLLTGGQIADCTAAGALLQQMPQTRLLHGDKGYDSNAVRRRIEAAGMIPNIPPKVNRRWKPCFSPLLYKDRNAIARMFGRIKDFLRIATRYDRLAANFLSVVCLTATICYWL